MRGKAKDESVFRMLQSERDRCIQVIDKILGEMEKLPKGSLGQRKVKSGDKEYSYPCLRYREGKHVKLEHISSIRADELQPALEKRKRLEHDLKVSRKRMNTINRILQKG